MATERFNGRFDTKLMDDMRKILGTMERRNMTYLVTKALEEYRDRNKQLLQKKTTSDASPSDHVPTN